MRTFEVVLRISTDHGERYVYVTIQAVNRGQAVLKAKHRHGGSLIHVS